MGLIDFRSLALYGRLVARGRQVVDGHKALHYYDGVN